MMPIKQRCPKCHGIFTGSDCIGRECIMCQVTGDLKSPPPIQSSLNVPDIITQDQSEELTDCVWMFNGRKVTVDHQMNIIDEDGEIVCIFMSNDDLKIFLKLLSEQ